MVIEFRNFQFDGVTKVTVDHASPTRREVCIYHVGDEGQRHRRVFTLKPDDDIHPMNGGESVEVSIKLKNYKEWAHAEATIATVRNKLNRILDGGDDEDVSCYNPCVLDEPIKMLAIARSQMAVATEK